MPNVSYDGFTYYVCYYDWFTYHETLVHSQKLCRETNNIMEVDNGK